MKKRTTALLLALCLLMSLVPMTAYAEASDWGATKSVSEIKSSYAIQPGLSSTASTTKYLGEGDILLKTMPTTTIGGYTYNAMAYCGVTASSSNPGVAAVKEGGFSIGTWEGGAFDGADALQVAITPKSLGTTVVEISYYYTFSQSSNPFTNTNAQWFKGTVHYTVTVKDPDDKPAGPTEADAKRFHNRVSNTSTSEGAVYLWCSESLYDHGAWYDYLTDVPNGYSFGEVVKNDGRNSKAPVSSYRWMCIMTVDHTAYLDAYNEELGAEVGTHYLKYPETTTTEVAWFHDGNGWRYVRTTAPVYIDITHEDTRARYTVTYTDGVDGEEVFPDQVYNDLLSGTATPAFEGDTPTREGYVFKGWNPEVADTVTGNATYTAIWKEDKNNNGIADDEEDKYTVTYTDGVDGEEVFPDQVYGDLLSGVATPAFEGTPTREGYVFKGWNPTVAETVTGNATYTAIWKEDKNNNGIADDEEDKYTVTYTDGVEDEEVFADQVYNDLLSGVATPAFEGTPTREGYVFKGWNPEVAETVTGNATYTAIWKEDKNNNNIPDDEEEKFTVTYTDGVDGEEVFPDQVYGDLLSGTATPAFEGTPTREGYVFKGWNPEVAETVTGNATYTAVWAKDENGNGIADDEEEKFTVRYTDGVDGEEVFPDQVYENLLSGTATPAFEGTPTREGYVFKGWNPEVAETVTGNATYTAVWEKDNGNGGDGDGDGDNDNTGDNEGPSSGDASNLLLWLAMLVVGGGAVIGTTVAGKKKMQSR